MSRPLPFTGAFLALALSATTAAHAQKPDTTTPRLRPATIAAGRVLYHGKGACAGCHGENGVGTPDGPSLTQGPWARGDGSLAWLIHMTRHAGWGARGRDGEPQRMRGPTNLDSAEVRKVASYVYSISRAKAPGQGGPIRQTP